MKTYSELVSLPTFKERYEYLKLSGKVGEWTFAHQRYLNQALYRSYEWKKLRREIIIRDNGCDLAFPELVVYRNPIIHHINPISKHDILERTEKVFDPENLILCSHQTHNAIHYGDPSLIFFNQTSERKPNDTCPWKE